MIKKRFTLKMYDCKVTIIIDDNLEDIYKKLCKKTKNHWEPGNLAGAVVTGDLDHYYLLLSKGDLTHNAIGHELHHLVTNIFKDRGIVEEESSAWLSGYLNELIYKTIEMYGLYPFSICQTTKIPVT